MTANPNAVEGLAEVQALRAEISRLCDALDPKIRALRFDDSGFRVQFATDAATDLAECYATICDEYGAQNFLEMSMETRGGAQFTVTVQRAEKPTPGALLREAKAEMAGLRKDAERYRWLRHKLTCGVFTEDESLAVAEARTGPSLDATIDAALRPTTETAAL